jgi:hypothetical protein
MAPSPTSFFTATLDERDLQTDGPTRFLSLKPQKTLGAQTEIVRVLILGTQAKGRARGTLVRGRDGVSAHFVVNVDLLRDLQPKQQLRIDWIVQSELLMTNVTFSVSAPDSDGGHCG